MVLYRWSEETMHNHDPKRMFCNPYPHTYLPKTLLTAQFGGLKTAYLPSFATRFQQAGYSVLIYDNRNWGDSDGLPGNEVDPLLQVRDYSDAFDFAAKLPEVDDSKIVF
jgi:hypothetical protein